MASSPSHRWDSSLLVLLVGGGILGGMVALVGMTGCSSLSSDSKPIPDSTFTRLLTEIHLTVARREAGVPYPKQLRDSVLARYGVDAAQFDAALEYYSRRPQDLKALYNPIIDSLNALQYQRRSSPAQQGRDSVSRRRRSGASTP